MDFELLTSVLKSDLPCAQRMILTVMLNHAGADNKAWPSHPVIAKQAGLVERSVWSHLKKLESSGWIKKVGQIGRVVIWSVTDPANPSVSIPQNLPLNPANISGIPAMVASESRNSCGLTTHEPLMNHLMKQVSEVHTNRKESEGIGIESERVSVGRKQKRQPIPPDSMEDVIEFATELDLPEKDGEWFWFKFEETAWTKNGGKEPVLDWKATMRTYEKGGWFPSQKSNGFKAQQPSLRFQDAPQHRKLTAPENWKAIYPTVTGRKLDDWRSWEDITTAEQSSIIAEATKAA